MAVKTAAVKPVKTVKPVKRVKNGQKPVKTGQKPVKTGRGQTGAETAAKPMRSKAAESASLRGFDRESELVKNRGRAGCIQPVPDAKRLPCIAASPSMHQTPTHPTTAHRPPTPTAPSGCWGWGFPRLPLPLVSPPQPTARTAVDPALAVFRRSPDNRPVYLTILGLTILERGERGLRPVWPSVAAAYSTIFSRAEVV